MGRELGGDVSIGRILHIPVTAIPIRVEPSLNGHRRLHKLAANYYRATGGIAAQGEGNWVLDAGTEIFCRSAAPLPCLEAPGVDGVFRLEASLGRFQQAIVEQPSLAGLVSKWRVDQILHATRLALRVDWLEGTSVKRGMKLDAVEKTAAEQESSGVWDRLEMTDWFNHEGGTAHYLFVCTEL